MYTENTACSIVCLGARYLSPESLPLHRIHMGQLIERELREAINDNIFIFRLGMNMGADIWAAERILKLRDTQFPHIELHCHLPCETQANHWPEHWRELYFDCLASADQVFFLQNHYSKDCKPRRTREMIAGSARLIALYDNIAEGSVDRAVSYAEAYGISVHMVQPLEGPPVRVDPRGRILTLGARQVLSTDQKSSAYSTMFSMGKSANMRACW